MGRKMSEHAHDFLLQLGNSESSKKTCRNMTISVSGVHVKKNTFLGFENNTLSLDFPSFGRSLVTPYGRCVERCSARIKSGDVTGRQQVE